jgi:hypothetical protein
MSSKADKDQITINRLVKRLGLEQVHAMVHKAWEAPMGAPSSHPEDSLDIIKIAYLVAHEGKKEREAVRAVIGGKVELNRARYDRLLARCTHKEGKRKGELRDELRWFAEQVSPGELPEGLSSSTLNIEELLMQKP